jgi:hypothetical protein
LLASITAAEARVDALAEQLADEAAARRALA